MKPNASPNRPPKGERTGRLSSDAILRLFQKPDYAPLTAGEIAAALSLKPKERKHLQGILDAMVRAGEIVILRTNRYGLGDPADLLTGRLEIRRNGAGLVCDTEGTPKLLVPKGMMATALPGDLVIARRSDMPSPTGQLPEGKIVRILERGQRLIVGTLRTTGRFYFVVPIDPAYDKDFYVPDPKGAHVGDRVVIQFAQWANSHVNPEAEIVDVIGPSEDPSLDTRTIIRHFDLAESFPPPVLHEAEEAAARLADVGPRKDLRDLCVFTIDPARARDFDDALSLERDRHGRRILGVHIADVSHFVPPDSALDREAFRRSTSVYFPDAVLPMLPEQLSNGVCSLRPEEDRLAFSVFLTFDERGAVVSRAFARTLIRSRLRLNYEQALAILQTGRMPGESPAPPEIVLRLKDLNDLAQQLRAARFARFALDIETPEYEFVLGPDQTIREIRVVPNDISHQLIEECMIAANEAVDLELSRRGLRLLHRVHEPPAETKIAELTTELQILGFRPGRLDDPRHLQAFLRSVKGHPLESHVQMAVLRSMKRAVYSARPDGHYGLAKSHYAHFTSPIRRYPDLVVHRILGAVLAGSRPPYQEPERLEQIAEHCTQGEQKAEEAERSLLEIKKYRYLEQQIRLKTPPVHQAVVVSVHNFGFFVELVPLGVQGLVHVSALSRRFVAFDAARRTLRAERATYSTGQRLAVRVARVDFDKRRVDFVPAGEIADPYNRTESASQRKFRRKRR